MFMLATTRLFDLLRCTFYIRHEIKLCARIRYCLAVVTIVAVCGTVIVVVLLFFFFFFFSCSNFQKDGNTF